MMRILCSTRGGEASLHTQDAAIRRAGELEAELVFFYVVDVEFLAHANYALQSDVVMKEIDGMADFLMAMAVERAEQQGVQARYIIRHGDFVGQLEQTIGEEQAGLVILGEPGEDEGAFKRAELKALASRIEKDTGVKVWIPGLYGE